MARALWHMSASGAHAQKIRSATPLLEATCADKGGSLAHLKQDGQALDDRHVRVAGVVEHDVLELDMVLDRVGLELHRQCTVDHHKEPGSCATHICDGCMVGMSDGCMVGMSDGCMVPRNVVQACVIEVSLACFVLPPQTLLLFHPVSTSSIGRQLPPGSYTWKMICGETGYDVVSLTLEQQRHVTRNDEGLASLY